MDHRDEQVQAALLQVPVLYPVGSSQGWTGLPHRLHRHQGDDSGRQEDPGTSRRQEEAGQVFPAGQDLHGQSEGTGH